MTRFRPLIRHRSLGVSRSGPTPGVCTEVAELATSPNTGMKPYRELEMKGLTIGGPGQGTFIESTLNRVAIPMLAKLWRSLVSWVTAAASAYSFDVCPRPVLVNHPVLSHTASDGDRRC